VNQAVCGYVFDQKTLAGIKALRKEPPAAITVAYGTNDWGRKGSGKEIRRDASAYLDRLCKLFPNTPIYVLTPLWRADEADEPTLAGIPNGKSLSWVRRAIERACRGHENVTVVDGASVLPRSPLMFADGRLHPGSTGAGIVAEAFAAAVRNGGVGVGGRGPQADPVSAPAPGPEVATTADALCAVDAESLSRPGVPGTHREFDRLVRTVWRLRQEDGCPWDREQTHESLVRYMVEEAYEAAEALRAGDASHMAEELGDVLYQVVLNSQGGCGRKALSPSMTCAAP
jgi:NTP pyrophosphatase (non-canonical NTP hydrolase)